MSCEVDIKHIVDEMALPTRIVSVQGLPTNQVAGVLAAVKQTVGQDCGAITDKGLGCYGLSLADLQLTGIIKCGFAYSSDLATALSDPSAFTGKYFITSVDGLLFDEAMQQKLMNEVIKMKMDELVLLGAITGDETDEELAEIAGMSSKFTTQNIVDKLLGQTADILTAAMTALAVVAAAGALVAKLKNADVLGKLKGFGKKIASLPKLAKNTINTADVDADADSIVGSSRIPSITDTGPEA